MRRSPVVASAGVLFAAALAASVTVPATAASASVAAPAAPSGLVRVGGPGGTTTPIKHVVVIIGENHTFDNVFATYQPPRGQHIENLLSQGIVTASGNPGPDYQKAGQYTASDTKTYTVTPPITGSYKYLPQPPRTR